VDLCKGETDSYYLGYSNGVLWPIFIRSSTWPFDASRRRLPARGNKLLAPVLIPMLCRRHHLDFDYHLIPMAARVASWVTEPDRFPARHYRRR
jgi:trehalose 6-phosphate synthase